MPTRPLVFLSEIVLVLATLMPATARAEVWPAKDWAVTTPESQGLSAAAFDAAAAFSQEHGGVSGCVIRFGLVKEWGPATAKADNSRNDTANMLAELLTVKFGTDLAKVLKRRVFDPIGVDPVVDPYPRSPVITRLTWAPPASIVRSAPDSDNWPLTWADDDHLYTAYGDGTGFAPKVPAKLSLGLARIAGGPGNFMGVNFRSPTGEQPKGDGKSGRKASGMLMVDGVLFLWVRNAGNAQLAWSSDHARTWTWADWKLTRSFGCPAFLNFGKNYAGARDDFVYVYSHDSDSAYQPADRVVLARVPKDRITHRDAYEFFKGIDPKGSPAWTRDLDERGAVFNNPGRSYRTQVSYNAGLKRYLLCQTGADAKGSVRAGFGIYDAPEPWGPWTTVEHTSEWDVPAGESCSFPTKWMSDDGKTLHLVFSGGDSFAVRKATLH